MLRKCLLKLTFQRKEFAEFHRAVSTIVCSNFMFQNNIKTWKCSFFAQFFREKWMRLWRTFHVKNGSKQSRVKLHTPYSTFNQNKKDFELHFKRKCNL